MELISQTDLLQNCLCTRTAFFFRHAGESQCQLDIGQDALVRNQIIALEKQTDGMIAVSIPVTVTVLLRRDSVDIQIAFV